MDIELKMRVVGLVAKAAKRILYDALAAHGIDPLAPGVYDPEELISDPAQMVRDLLQLAREDTEDPEAAAAAACAAATREWPEIIGAGMYAFEMKEAIQHRERAAGTGD